MTNHLCDKHVIESCDKHVIELLGCSAWLCFIYIYLVELIILPLIPVDRGLDFC